MSGHRCVFKLATNLDFTAPIDFMVKATRAGPLASIFGTTASCFPLLFDVQKAISICHNEHQIRCRRVACDKQRRLSQIAVPLRPALFSPAVNFLAKKATRPDEHGRQCGQGCGNKRGGTARVKSTARLQPHLGFFLKAKPGSWNLVFTNKSTYRSAAAPQRPVMSAMISVIACIYDDVYDDF